RVGMLDRDGGGADDDLSSVGFEHVALVLADLVGADEYAPVALALRDHGQPDPGVTRGRLDDRAARCELAGSLRRLHHPQRDPVLHAAAGVEVLHLRQHQRREVPGDAVQPDQRGVTDQIDDVLGVVHGVSRAGIGLITLTGMPPSLWRLPGYWSRL